MVVAVATTTEIESGGNKGFHRIPKKKLTSSAANNVTVYCNNKLICYLSRCQVWEYSNLSFIYFFEGYGIADEFVDQYFCSEKCRKLSVAQPTKSKSREGGAAAGKVAVKRKSTSSNSSSQAGDAANNAIVESSLEPCNEQTNKDGDLKASWKLFHILF